MAARHRQLNTNLQSRQNILILAESGVNKQAWLNKWAIYLTFPHLSSALCSNASPNSVKCSQSEMTLDVFKGKALGRSMRFVAAPQEWDVNQELLQCVSAYLKKNSMRIHGVILLLRWNESGFFLNNFSRETRSAINALVQDLDEDAASNALFGFVSNSGGIYHPGDSWYRAGSLLKLRKHFIDLPDEHVEISAADDILHGKEHFLDSDPFFYLQRVKIDLLTRDSQKITEYEAQWKQCRSALANILDALMKRTKANIPNTVNGSLLHRNCYINMESPRIDNHTKYAKKSHNNAGSAKKQGKNAVIKWIKRLFDRLTVC